MVVKKNKIVRRMDFVEIKEKINVFMETSRVVKEFEYELSKLKEEFMNFVDENGADAIECFEHKITKVETAPRKSFDYEKFFEEHPELEQYKMEYIVFSNPGKPYVKIS